jgi:predicted AAA+ superfamily ATPase
MEIKREFESLLAQRIHQSDLNFIQVLLGPRQVGKSTAIRHVTESWAGSSVVESADQLSPPNVSWIEFLWQKAIELPPPCLLVIDEIQKIDRWSEAIKILFDRDRRKNRLRIILSGSASLAIQGGLSDSLAGRYELIRAPHWSLSECKEAFNWNITEFLKFGGYPAAASLVSDVPRWQSYLRDGIIEPVLGRDLQTAVQVQKPALLRQLFSLVMHYPAQEVSYQKLMGQLQDRGNAATIKHYLEILSGGFLILTLDKFSTNPLRRKSSSPKIIPLASALIHAFADPDRLDTNPEWRGHVFESAIGAHLARLNEELFYWRDGKNEVDFVVMAGRKLFAIEVKSGRKKTSNGLIEFKKRFTEAIPILINWETGKEFLAQPPSLIALESLAIRQ